ncbi:YfiT family bacillithiol transferase [Tuwongella immobilis]|uniref:DinB-like domain-containing protein n=1 Tax=Tuwongella immobilis TaxID=692036 RepID=A0A6C2YIM7_9BACT|nr:putative metal-dependent hydrolase [Tuwongella immobilis]VIP01266.1 Putative metal-dependent hydrolase IIW_01519 OS=Bacillus cereus VD136 GN=IIW_01519 PE=3 SV=1: DinB_2 [Tuwongella immobilis]VTR97958.1 Putative metal-dependent hydrolase IIW_01519 OS=Bacillus cereus VD136 GN=IIW_01519 PE=3 SV=1: DinB_2 [Tuwongella immobilis]
MTPPKHPAGEHQPNPNPTPESRAACVAQLESLADQLVAAVAGLDADQLGTKYVNWTIRQIIAHLADSHANAFIRFKWALTEDHPTIKAYKQWEWSQLPDGDLDPSLSIPLIAALHARWAYLVKQLRPKDFAKTFLHPEGGKVYTLDSALEMYAWHGRHHTAQITWIRQNRGW